LINRENLVPGRGLELGEFPEVIQRVAKHPASVTR
jgi:hypothetical protein